MLREFDDFRTCRKKRGDCLMMCLGAEMVKRGSKGLE